MDNKYKSDYIIINNIKSVLSNKKNLMSYKNPNRDSSPVEKNGNEK